MKKTLLLFAKLGVEKGNTFPADLTAAINAANRGVIASHTLLENLLFVVNEDKIDIIDTDNNRPLGEYDSIYFRYWGDAQGAAMAVARFCTIKGIPFVDTETLRVGSFNKITQHVNLHEADVPIPRTLMGNPTVLTANYETYGFKFPLILKSVSATRGRDNFLAKDANEMAAIFESLPDKLFVMQDFIPNDGDYRVLVMGDKVVLVIERKAKGDSHLNNTSQGGSAVIVPNDALPQEVLDASVRAAQFFGREIAGVDMVRSLADGRYYCFEVNRSPQIEHASFESEKAVLLADYLASL